MRDEDEDEDYVENANGVVDMVDDEDDDEFLAPAPVRRRRRARNAVYGLDYVDLKLEEVGDDADAPPVVVNNIYGLTVNLHNYQKQAVHYMVNEERHPEGSWRHLWVKMPSKNRMPHDMYYSPYFDRFWFGEPMVQHGGFLCEEMGLGKTVEALALVHINPMRKPLPASYMPTPDKGLWQRYASRGTLIIASTSLVGQWKAEIKSKLARDAKVLLYYGSRPKDPKKVKDYDFVLTTYAILQREDGRQEHECLHRIDWHRVILDESHEIKNRKTRRAKSITSLIADNRWCLTGTPMNMSLQDFHGQVEFLRVRPADNERFWKEANDNFTNGNLRRLRPVFRMMEKMMCRHHKDGKYQGLPLVELPEKKEETVMLSFTESQARVYRNLYEMAKIRYDGFVRLGVARKKTLEIWSMLLPLRQASSFARRFPVDVAKALAELKAPGPDRPIGRPNEEKFAEAFGPVYNEGQECSICFEEMEAPLQTPCGHQFCKACLSAFFARHDRVRENCPLCRAAFKLTDCKVPKKKVDGSVPLVPVECEICFENVKDGVKSACRHKFCRTCITDALKLKKKCPVCRKALAPGQLEDLPKSVDENNENDMADSDGAGANNGQAAAVGGGGADEKKEEIVFDVKVKYLLSELRRIRREKPKSKVLVFTQFRNMISTLAQKFNGEHWPFRTLEGDMSMHERTRNLVAFQTGETTHRRHNRRKTKANACHTSGAPFVFLLTMRSGGVGITLTAADHLYIMEPCVNPALERQVINRAYRIGQKRVLHVKRLVMANSIEARIIEANKKRDEENHANANGGNGNGNEDSSSPSRRNAGGNAINDRRSIRSEENAKFFADLITDVAKPHALAPAAAGVA